MKLREGVWYPDSEKGLPGDVASLDDLREHVLPAVKGRILAVQAGGAVGLWAATLAQAGFCWIHSFEPNPALRECFHKNIRLFDRHDGIVLHSEALGANPGKGAIGGEKDWNMGSWSVRAGDTCDIRTIDSLNLVTCDLIMLDIEGMELEALKGAYRTIERCKPVIVVEMKEQCLNQFGSTKEDLRAYLRSFKYKLHSSFHGERDEMWIPHD
jgi:FkbM family methyltransferase